MDKRKQVCVCGCMCDVGVYVRVMRVCMLRRRPSASPPDLPSRFQSSDNVCNDAFPAKDVRILAQDSGGKRL